MHRVHTMVVTIRVVTYITSYLCIISQAAWHELMVSSATFCTLYSLGYVPPRKKPWDLLKHVCLTHFLMPDERRESTEVLEHW